MTTLAANVGIGDNQITIDTPLAVGQVPGWVKIDSEMLYVGGQQHRTGTTLVLGRPARSTHSSGATVTYAGNPYDADFLSATGGGGSGVTVDNQSDPPAAVTTLVAPGAVLSDGEADLSALEGTQRIRLLGPFHVVHDTPGLDGGVELAEVAAGTWLFGVGIVATEARFGGTDTPDVQVGFAKNDLSDLRPGFHSNDWASLESNGSDTVLGVPIGTVATFAPVGMSAAGVLAMIAAWSGTVTAGEWDVYALIAEPAA